MLYVFIIANVTEVDNMGEYGIKSSIAELSETIMEANPHDEMKCGDCGHKRYNHHKLVPGCKICDCVEFKED